MRKTVMRFLLVVLALVLSSCAAPRPLTGPAGADRTPSLYGGWDLVAVDGRPPVPSVLVERRPTLLFATGSYGGHSGCNSFFGVGLQHEGRWFGGDATRTQIGCPDPLGSQEEAMFSALHGASRLEWAGPDRVTLIGKDHRLTLRRTSATVKHQPAPPPPLADTRWSLRILDGELLGIGPETQPTLTLAKDRYRIEHACLRVEGRWTQTGAGTLALASERRTSRTCEAVDRGQGEALASALAGPLRYLATSLGEILIVGRDGHFAEGMRFAPPSRSLS